MGLATAKSRVEVRRSRNPLPQVPPAAQRRAPSPLLRFPLAGLSFSYFKMSPYLLLFLSSGSELLYEHLGCEHGRMSSTFTTASPCIWWVSTESSLHQVSHAWFTHGNQRWTALLRHDSKLKVTIKCRKVSNLSFFLLHFHRHRFKT